MANIVQLRRSTTAASVPTTGQLLDGELAVNVPDGKVYFRVGTPGSYTIKEVGAVSSVAGKTGVVTLVNADVAGSAPTASPTFTGTVTLPTAQLITDVRRSSATITASATNTQAGATLLTADYNIVSAFASGGSGYAVRLPAAAATKVVTVLFQGAGTLNVYPATGETIDLYSTNTAATYPYNSNPQIIHFYGSSSGVWYTSANAPVTGSVVTGNVNSALSAYVAVTGQWTLAAAGTNQATATSIFNSSSSFNIVNVTSGTGGLSLPANSLQHGYTFTVYNKTGAAITVYPATGGTIYPNALNAGVSVAAGAVVSFVYDFTISTWITPGLYGTVLGSSISGAVASATNATQLNGVAASGYALLSGTNTFTGTVTLPTGQTINDLRKGFTTVVPAGAFTQSGATLLSNDVNYISTAPTTTNNSVKLPAANSIGKTVTIIGNWGNLGTAALGIFPNTGDTIDYNMANAGFSLDPKIGVSKTGFIKIDFTCVAAGMWVSSLATSVHGENVEGSVPFAQVAGKLQISNATYTAAGTTQATANQLGIAGGLAFCRVTSGTGGVYLPTPSDPASQQCIVRVYNETASPINLYPASGNAFLPDAVNVPISIPAGKFVEVFCTNANGNWYHGNYYTLVSGSAVVGNVSSATTASVSTTQTAGDATTNIATTAFVQTAAHGALSKDISGGATTTLTAAEAGNATFILTGALATNATVVFPNSARKYQISNRTTNPFTVTVKTASGTGVVIPQGMDMSFYSDGTNMVEAVDYITAANLGTASVAVTQATGDNSTKLATTAFVKAQNYITSSGAPVQSFNTRTGAITLTSSDVTTALTYTPVNSTLLGANNGVATLDSGGKLTTSQIPSALVGGMVYQGTWNATTNTPQLLSGIGTKGYLYKVSVAGTSINVNTSAASSASTTVTVTSTTGITPGMLVTGTGIGTTVTVASVTNATTLVVSSAVTISSGVTLTFQSYLDGITSFRVGDSIVYDGTTWDAIDGTTAEVTSFQGRTGAVTLNSADVTGALGFTPYNSTNPAGYATLASPTFTGSVNAPTPTTSDNSTLVATTAFVKAQSYLTTSLASSTYAPLASPSLTGTPTAPTMAGVSTGTQLATVGYVTRAVSEVLPVGVSTADYTLTASDIAYRHLFVSDAPADGRKVIFPASGVKGTYHIVNACSFSIIVADSTVTNTVTIPALSMMDVIFDLTGGLLDSTNLTYKRHYPVMTTNTVTTTDNSTRIATTAFVKAAPIDGGTY